MVFSLSNAGLLNLIAFENVFIICSSPSTATAAVTDFIENDWADEIQTYKKGRK